MTIAYNVDAYGTYARLSSTADYVELLALKGRNITLADLGDFIADSSSLLARDLLTDGLLSDTDEEMDDSGSSPVMKSLPSEAAIESARRVIGLLDQRSRILGALYPFVITVGEVRRKPNVRPQSNAYIALLTLTTAHAYKLSVPRDVTQVFEETVSRVVKKRIPRTTGFAAARRATGNFVDALSSVCAELGLAIPDHAVVLSRRIHDGGCDTLSHIDWGDERTGKWTFVGQVTCARSDDWELKAWQARPDRWWDVLNDLLRPTPFLAVPHHVEDLKLHALTRDTQTLVLDRLRLAPFMTPIAAEERKIIEAVLSEDVEYS